MELFTTFVAHQANPVGFMLMVIIMAIIALGIVLLCCVVRHRHHQDEIEAAYDNGHADGMLAEEVRQLTLQMSG
jgi:hypothetical protein